MKNGIHAKIGKLKKLQLKTKDMGWKSTVDITRDEAISLIFAKLATIHTLSDSELADLLESLGYGEDSNLVYYGHNFNVISSNSNS